MKNLSTFQSLISHVVITGFIACLFTGEIKANEAVETLTEKKVEQKVTADQIAEWIKSLDSNNPETRQQAAAQLQQSGTAAVGALAKAADTKNPELSAQCVEVLKNMYESKDTATKNSATAALKALEKSKIQQVAQRAREVTKNPNPVPANRFGNQAIQIQAIRMAIANAQKIAQKKIPNKELKRTVKDGNKTIEIRETPNKEIVVKITEKIDGKDKVTETKAKNIIELRKKNKEAYEMYRKHKPKAPPQPRMNFGGGNIQIMMNGAAGNMRMKQTNNNGQRHTEVEQNGRKIEIDDFNDTDIVVKITEKVDSKEKTTEVKAKDLDELKKKHPKAAKEYEKHIKGGKGMNIRLFGGAGNIQGLQKIQEQHKKMVEEMKKKMQKQIEENKKRIQDIQKGIET